ncbi:L,D-transpeptidase family protein [Dictyobacter kobayashii]|uniref:L,D-TPase catalytic domain-containing protein n=1 Tax=Dictyobacter kobayashii TaxID=2014872 RepID=A0A402AXX9_9CHLR|nr:L,D-transpeptidase family protein [Dictyobacter kobayashii]GCE23956.1 hypothetical protein KDK_77560 [Dictyobacter kobayashii]
MQKQLKTLMLWGVLLIFALSIVGMVAARQYYTTHLVEPAMQLPAHVNTARSSSSLRSNNNLQAQQNQRTARHGELATKNIYPYILANRLSILGKDERAFIVNWNSTPITAYATDWANVRSSPYSDGSLLGSAAPGTTLTIYGSIIGENPGTTSTWYRVSDQQSTPQYVYSGVVSTSALTQSNWNPANTASVPATGKAIIINITNQWLYAYQDGQQITSSAITTGRPGLDTPIGTFQIFNKESPTTFYSIWPSGSPYYFAPTRIQFALEFLSAGYFIHDAFWRNDYGPGSNIPHYIPGYGTESGSHGCVNVPYGTMSWLYNWADIGTTVEITY